MTIPELFEFAKENHVSINIRYNDIMLAYQITLEDNATASIFGEPIRSRVLFSKEKLQAIKDEPVYLEACLNDILDRIKEAKQYEIFN